VSASFLVFSCAGGAEVPFDDLQRHGDDLPILLGASHDQGPSSESITLIVMVDGTMRWLRLTTWGSIVVC
jgi:hypothetical protein